MNYIDFAFAVATLSLTLWGIWRVNRLHPGDGILMYIIAPLFSVSSFALFIDAIVIPEYACAYNCTFSRLALTGALLSVAAYLWWGAWRAVYGNRRNRHRGHGAARG